MSVDPVASLSANRFDTANKFFSSVNPKITARALGQPSIVLDRPSDGYQIAGFSPTGSRRDDAPFSSPPMAAVIGASIVVAADGVGDRLFSALSERPHISLRVSLPFPSPLGRRSSRPCSIHFSMSTEKSNHSNHRIVSN
jgi:hypothetical protein